MSTVDGMTRQQLGAMIAQRLGRDAGQLRADFGVTGQVRSCVIDDLLDPELAQGIFERFPSLDECQQKKNVREYKYIAAQMDRYHPVLEEIIFAFQQPEVMEVVTDITGIPDMYPDPNLYAGGLSMMARDNYLTPHLDDSHDNAREMYRVLNLLYYVSPGWQLGYGGNLQLWDDGLKSEPRTIHSRFNRLALMATNRSSFHSVSKVEHDGVRCCVSNYYFSPHPVAEDGTVLSDDYAHVTEFRGFPGDVTSDLLLRTDAAVKNVIRKVYKRPMRDNHKYVRDDD